jgi:hypothetical protein
MTLTEGTVFMLSEETVDSIVTLICLHLLPDIFDI